MQKIKQFTLIFFLTNSMFGQTNFEKFKNLFKEKDTISIKNLIHKWEKTDANDPELYTSAFNFNFYYSKQDVLSLQPNKPKNESFQLKDSIGNIAGYITSNSSYNLQKLSKAFKYINIGIQKHPNRLDIRFGKCYALGEIGDYDNFTKEIIKIIEYSNINKNNWLWTENKKLEDAEDFMIGSIQSYLFQLYNNENENLLSNMLQIGELTLKFYPKKVQILSTTAVANMINKNYEKALEYLKTAEQINPEDCIVLNNIALIYKTKNDKINSIKYYNLVEKYGNNEQKEIAIRNLNELKK